MKEMRPLLITLAVWLTVFLCVSSAFAEGKGIFYVVRSRDAAAYLMGSIHVGNKDFYPLPQHVEKDFKDAGVLMLEVDPARMNSPEVQQELLRYAMYPEGDELRNHLTPSTYDLAMKKAALAGLPAATVTRLRPWVLAVTLQVLIMQKEGFSAEDGVEMYFIRRGEGGKRIEELESADFQMKLLNGFSEKEQELFLLDTLDNQSDKAAIDAMILAWKTGDAKALENTLMQPLREQPELMPIYDKLIFSRNRTMAAKIEQALKGKTRPFIIIGAGHLIGAKGVVQLLRSKGYSVEQQ